MEKYKKSYKIKSFECDFQGKLRLRSLFNLLQDMADAHADVINVGYDFCKQNNLGWVCGAYHLVVHSWPVWNDDVIIETWPSGTTAASGIRDFQMTRPTGEVMVRATSQWVLVDALKMRPVSVAKHLPHYTPVDEHVLPPEFDKIPDLTGVETNTCFPVHEDDIDLNQHVNNALYPSWALDGLNDTFLREHTPADIKITFKRSAKRGNQVRLQTFCQDFMTMHKIMDADSGTEFARVLIEWRPQ